MMMRMKTTTMMMMTTSKPVLETVDTEEEGSGNPSVLVHVYHSIYDSKV